MTRLWSLLLALAALAFAVSPWLTPGFDGFAGLDGFEPKRFARAAIDPPIQPATYAFRIWGVIQLWLVVGCLFGVFRRIDDIDWAPMRLPLLASLILGAVWIPAAATSPILGTVLIWAMLAMAMLALFRVGDTDRWLQQVPVALYAGWLTAMACVALGLLLTGYGWLPATPAALVALCLTLAISIAAQYFLHRAPEYGITVIWALVAIIASNWQPLNVAVSGLAAIGVFAILSLRGTDTE